MWIVRLQIIKWLNMSEYIYLENPSKFFGILQWVFSVSNVVHKIKLLDVMCIFSRLTFMPQCWMKCILVYIKPVHYFRWLKFMAMYETSIKKWMFFCVRINIALVEKNIYQNQWNFSLQALTRILTQISSHTDLHIGYICGYIMYIRLS